MFILYNVFFYLVLSPVRVVLVRAYFHHLETCRSLVLSLDSGVQVRDAPHDDVRLVRQLGQLA